MSEVIAWSAALVALIWMAGWVRGGLAAQDRTEIKRSQLWLGRLAEIIPVSYLMLGAATILAGVGGLPNVSLAFPFQALGLLIAIGTEVLAARARMELGGQLARGVEVWAEQRLVTKGLYGFVRHPLYLGSIALGLGLGLGLWSWTVLLATLVVALPILWWLSRQEERLLVERFGEAYQEYQARVPMLSPWPRRGRVEPEVADQPDVAEQE